MKWLCLLCCCAWATLASADDLNPMPFAEDLGAQVPVHARFTQTDGTPTDLATLMQGRPALLVLGYYRCPMLCETTMDGILESLRGIALPYEILAVSIDPTEGPTDAIPKQRRYAATMDASALARLHLLTGAAEPITQLARVIGFPYRRDPATGQFAHPAGFVVLTPAGRISRYVTGVRVDSDTLRTALDDAGRGRIGTLVDQVLLFCAHYDPATGRWTPAVMRLTQVAGGVTLVLLAALVCLHRRRVRAGGRPT
jgi:protein SCO1/2